MTSENQDYRYIGSELEVFKHAVNWKNYWYQRIAPYVGQKVLEVGAGIGGTTRIFKNHDCEQWIALEPDADMIPALEKQASEGLFPQNTEVIQSTVQDLDSEMLFDSILYIDVLEHIEDHENEVLEAAKHLLPGGYLIILSPAFQFLYTEFDESIGHFRRYHQTDFAPLTPPDCKIVDLCYLDAIGALASVMNLLFLHSSQPSLGRIKFWDNFMVPVSHYVDPLIAYNFGRSVICTWQRKR